MQKTGITAYEDTFKSKNTYENTLTEINKEENNKMIIADITLHFIYALKLSTTFLYFS
jgi:hypothetical protein